MATKGVVRGGMATHASTARREHRRHSSMCMARSARAAATPAPAHKVRSVRMHAFNPNDPMTWNQPEDEPMPAPTDEPPTTFLSEADLSALLSTPMGTSPTSVEAVQVVQAAVAPAKQPVSAGPEDAREAIAQGLARYGEGDHTAALQLFETALTLPGTGTLRDRKKQRELSDGEKMSALYNIACCHSRLDDARNGLIALAGALEAGFDDFATARSDADLATLRSEAQFEGLLQRFQPAAPSGPFGFIQKLF